MRRNAVVLCALLLVTAMTVPAGAAKPSKGTDEWRSAEAAWSSVEWTSRNTYVETWTWVWAYESAWGGGVWVDQDRVTCRTSNRGETCRYGGYTSGSGDGGVTVAADLSGARATTTVHMDSGARSAPLALDVTWTGTGPVFKSRGSWSGGDDCFSYRTTYRGQSRAANATGTLGGTDLGASHWGSIGVSAERYSFRDSCDYS